MSHEHYRRFRIVTYAHKRQAHAGIPTGPLRSSSLALERATKIDMNVGFVESWVTCPRNSLGSWALVRSTATVPGATVSGVGRWGGRRIGFLPGRICLAARSQASSRPRLDSLRGLPMSCVQSTVVEPAENILNRHTVQGLTDCLVQAVLRPRRDPAKLSLELRPQLLDRVVVRAMASRGRTVRTLDRLRHVPRSGV